MNNEAEKHKKKGEQRPKAKEPQPAAHLRYKPIFDGTIDSATEERQAKEFLDQVNRIRAQSERNKTKP